MCTSLRSWLKSLYWKPSPDLGFQSGHAFIGYAGMTVPYLCGAPWWVVLLVWSGTAIYMGLKESIFDPLVEKEPLWPDGWRDITYWGIGSVVGLALVLIHALS